MNRLVLESKVDAVGKLILSVDIGLAEANRDVRVIIEPLAENSAAAKTQQDWVEFVHRTAGSVPDPSFRRHAQGEFEKREEFP
jgi:hypothetical protein